MKRSLLVLVLLSTLPTAPLVAQDDRDWTIGGELGASVFFGASRQTAIIFRSAYEHTADRWDFAAQGSFNYGEAETQEGSTRVNKRAWSSEMSLDYETGSFAPFVFGSGEGSLERQIDLRLAGGAGSRYNFVRDDRTRMDLSVAILAEYTNPRGVPGEMSESEILARWSNRVRASRKFMDDRAEFGLVAFYKPAFRDTDDYTVEAESNLSFALNSSLTLKVSLVDKYDNLATGRGAAANNDGRMYFSLLAEH